MMNFDNIPGNILSGVDDAMLDFITNESSDRYITELDPTFFNAIVETDKLDQVLSEERNDILTQLEKDAIANSTEKQTKSWVAFLKAKGIRRSSYCKNGRAVERRPLSC